MLEIGEQEERSGVWVVSPWFHNRVEDLFHVYDSSPVKSLGPSMFESIRSRQSYFRGDHSPMIFVQFMYQNSFQDIFVTLNRFFSKEALSV